jgi:hypothetical protein
MTRDCGVVVAVKVVVTVEEGVKVPVAAGVKVRVGVADGV